MGFSSVLWEVTTILHDRSPLLVLGVLLLRPLGAPRGFSCWTTLLALHVLSSCFLSAVTFEVGSPELRTALRMPLYALAHFLFLYS